MEWSTRLIFEIQEIHQFSACSETKTATKTVCLSQVLPLLFVCAKKEPLRDSLSDVSRRINELVAVDGQ